MTYRQLRCGLEAVAFGAFVILSKANIDAVIELSKDAKAHSIGMFILHAVLILIYTTAVWHSWRFMIGIGRLIDDICITLEKGLKIMVTPTPQIPVPVTSDTLIDKDNK